MWQTPKTDWYGAVDADGHYIGDRFNAVDFNRIKNNLQYLRDLAIQMYEEFSIVSLGADRTPRDYFYADEINQLEANLMTINDKNGNTMDFNELNRLEGAILDLYDRLQNQADGRRMFTWNFGMKGGGL